MFPLRPGDTKVKKPYKTKPKLKQTHTAPVARGVGDGYGSGAKNPIGKPRSIMGIDAKPLSKKVLRKPPKNLA